MRNGKRFAEGEPGVRRSTWKGKARCDNVNNDKRRLQENYLIWLGGIPFEFVDETSIFPWGVDVYYG